MTKRDDRDEFTLKLRALSMATGVPQARIVRRAVEEMIERHLSENHGDARRFATMLAALRGRAVGHLRVVK